MHIVRKGRVPGTMSIASITWRHLRRLRWNTSDRKLSVGILSGRLAASSSVRCHRYTRSTHQINIPFPDIIPSLNHPMHLKYRLCKDTRDNLGLNFHQRIYNLARAVLANEDSDPIDAGTWKSNYDIHQSLCLDLCEEIYGQIYCWYQHSRSKITSQSGVGVWVWVGTRTTHHVEHSLGNASPLLLIYREIRSTCYLYMCRTTSTRLYTIQASCVSFNKSVLLPQPVSALPMG